RVLAIVFAASIGAASTVLAGPPSRPPAKPPVKAPAPKPASPGSPDAKAPKPARPAGFIAHIEANPVLVARLTPLLPTGVSRDAAANGFRNQGQFIAALHAAHNLHLSFTDLKTAMTGDPHESLGQAIQKLDPGVDAKQAAKLADFEGKVDVEEAKENASD